MAMLAIWTAVLLLFGLCTPPSLGDEEDCYPLDMAPNSVDDMYNGCEDKMKGIIEPLLNKEQREEFKDAWSAAQNYYKRKIVYYTTLYKLKSLLSNTPKLKKKEIMAVHAYTLETPALYSKFNVAVRTQKSDYKTETFKYHAVHFFLTMALRSLNHDLKCVTSYRRTKCNFKTAINSEIRFGAFTSSTEGSYPPAEFGEKSCFEIYTCFGADISKFSKFPQEKEVLIPPYEVFKVKDIKKRSATNSLPCDVVYKLESTKEPHSNLNCALAKKLSERSGVKHPIDKSSTVHSWT
ncbi:ecto-ADP-ribosyltransferase 5-like [Fundulus heteroclitus]|uniref:ecto-ADP-ribosyltransferase 5-like n=1 Tax=Fundulus heteroclitus TaxID=8078 RepID=UPI00165AA699|nr:ecto-ADP-ribosyltransferase 5-like [Fundulus heteroclitus]